MSEEKKMPDAQRIKDILSVVSDKVPALIKALVGGIFTEEVGRGMGKAAAAFYAELKAGGLPDQAALEMTRDYIKGFTNLGGLFNKK